MTIVGRVIGTTHVSQFVGIPVVITFTTGSNGRIPSPKRSVTQSRQPIGRLETDTPTIWLIARITRNRKSAEDGRSLNQPGAGHPRWPRAFKGSTTRRNWTPNAGQPASGCPMRKSSTVSAAQITAMWLNPVGLSIGIVEKSEQPKFSCTLRLILTQRPRSTLPVSPRRARCQALGRLALRYCPLQCQAGWSPLCRPP